jgi:Glycosyl hydrolase family 12
MLITRYLRQVRLSRAGRSRLTAGFLALGTLLGTVLPALQPASAATPKLLCNRYQHVAVRAVPARSYWVRNDYWGTGAMCMANNGTRPNFTVVRAGQNHIGGAVMAYPYIFSGCSWGICTPGSGLPAKASSLRAPRSTWHMTASAGGTWDASYDLWFARHRKTNGQAKGAELMIWLKSSSMPLASHRKVTIDGTQWYLAHWHTANRGQGTWNYIQFRRVHPTSKVDNLNLAPFIHQAEHVRVHHRPLVRASWWLLNIEAGFELIHGGAGLATNTFSAHV